MDLAIYLLAIPVVGSEQADEFLVFLLVDFYPDTRLSRNMDWDYVLRQDRIKENAKCVRFKQGSNAIQVLRKRLEPEMASEGAYRFCPTRESYIEGEEILERGRRVVSRPG